MDRIQPSAERGLRGWTLATVSVATFMLLLDISAVVTALPSIERDLGAGFTDLQWVIDAYTVALAAFVLSAGSLADRYGRKRTFVVGLAVFSAASLAAALSPDPTFLNGFRAVQGLGAAAMFATSLALLADAFPEGPSRGSAMAVYGATIGIAVAIGPLVGGALTEVFGWEAIFLINVPIGLVAIAATQMRLRESRRVDPPRLDRLGLVTLTGALLLLVLGLLRGNADGWTSGPILAALTCSLVLLVAFIAAEARATDPMLPLGLFRNRAFTGVQVAAVAVSASIFALFAYITLYLQNVQGLSPVEAGLCLLPSTLPMFGMPAVVGALAARISPRTLVTGGLAITGIGLIWMSALDAGDEWTALLGGLMLTGTGIGILNPAIADLSVSTVEPERAGMAAGANDTARQAGIAIGIAAWGAVILARGADRAAELLGISGASSDLPRRMVEATSTGTVEPTAARLGEVSFVAGLNLALLLGGAVALAGAAACSWLLRDAPVQTFSSNQMKEEGNAISIDQPAVAVRSRDGRHGRDRAGAIRRGG
jgi:EmrB/QacA subfamily drug resistance transporter